MKKSFLSLSLCPVFFLSDTQISRVAFVNVVGFVFLEYLDAVLVQASDPIAKSRRAVEHN